MPDQRIQIALSQSYSPKQRRKSSILDVEEGDSDALHRAPTEVADADVQNMVRSVLYFTYSLIILLHLDSTVGYPETCNGQEKKSKKPRSSGKQKTSRRKRRSAVRKRSKKEGIDYNISASKLVNALVPSVIY